MHMKILFYYNSTTLPDTIYKGANTYIGIVNLYLKTYIDKNNPELAKKLEWSLPLQITMSDDDLVAHIEKEKPDMLCVSYYIWNRTILSQQLARIRPRLSDDILIVAGGPELDVNVNPKFFEEYPFLDYAIYGPGELAFAQLLECLVEGKKPNPFEMSNISWHDRGIDQTVVAGFKYVAQSKVSPFLENKEFFNEMVNDLRTQSIGIVLTYELTRGCPYACTFCDWNSGLTNKTTRRKDTWQQEMEFFVDDMGINQFYLADANVGQYDEDIDMLTWMRDKNLNENAQILFDGNLSKLRKENNLKAYHLIGQGTLSMHFVISLQDTNTDILKNIDRPDIGWPEHQKIIREIQPTYPHIPVDVQVIQGLPGQTPATWRETLGIVTAENVMPLIFMSELLATSPAARSAEYKDKFNFTYSTAVRWFDQHQEEFSGKFPESCSSFNKEDVITMTMISCIYSSIAWFRNFTSVKERFDIEKVVDTFFASEQYVYLSENLRHNWYNHNKYYFTIDFMGDDRINEPLSACTPYGRTSANWCQNATFLCWIAKNLIGDYPKSTYIKDHLWPNATGNIAVNIDIYATHENRALRQDIKKTNPGFLLSDTDTVVPQGLHRIDEIKRRQSQNKQDL